MVKIFNELPVSAKMSITPIIANGIENNTTNGYTKEVIENYKKQKYKIGVFITGKKNYPEVLKKIVMKQVEVEQNVC